MQIKSLEGVRVIDLSRVIAGPHASMILGDLGADIIKVEKKGEGDISRQYAPFYRGASTYFITHNRNKRSMTLDFRAPEGIALLRRMLRRADVLVENFKAGTLEKMGLDPAQLLEENPRLVITRISGFGQTGPYARRPCFDAVAQSMSGLMDMTGDPAGPPMMMGAYVCDMFAGVYAAAGTLAALYARERTGRGQVVDAALFDAASALTHSAVTNYYALGLTVTRNGNQDRASWPATFYPTRDGRWVFIHAGQDASFAAMCRMIGREDVLEREDLRTLAGRAEHIGECDELVASWTRTRDAEDILAACNRAGLPCSKVNTVAEMARDPQLLERQMIRTVDMPDIGPLTVNGPVLKMSETNPDLYRTAPRLGEHTREILEEVLSLAPEEVEALEARGVI